MDNSNLPDNCQGNDPRFPWNEPEELICPNCNDTLSMDDEELHCDNSECDYVEILDEPEEY